MATTLKLTPDVGDATLSQAWLEEANETAEPDTHTRRHHDPRTAWDVPLEIHVCSGSGYGETYYATACDISKGGIGFRCRELIPPFTTVHICRAGEMIGVPALTMNCTESLTGSIIGAEFRFEKQAPAQRRVSKAG